MGKTKRGRPGNSNDVDRVARRETPVRVSSGSEEGWKREYDWFVRVAIHEGRRCRLESALFLDPERSISLVSAERHERKVDGGWEHRGGGRFLDETRIATESWRKREENQTRTRARKRNRQGKARCSWRTNRRSLTDVATPYVTFIADALPRHLLISTRSS